MDLSYGLKLDSDVLKYFEERIFCQNKELKLTFASFLIGVYEAAPVLGHRAAPQKKKGLLSEVLAAAETISYQVFCRAGFVRRRSENFGITLTCLWRGVWSLCAACSC